MKSFRYEGLTAGGAPVEGLVEAFDKADAITQARAHCRVLVKIEPVSGGKLGDLLRTDLGALFSGGRITPKKLALLSSQLAITQKAGLPLVRALHLIAENEGDPHLRSILEDAADDVRSGHTLADALQHRAPKLPTAFLETIRAGEASGTLAESFTRLKAYYEQSAAVAARVSTAMVYPAILVLAAIAVITLIMVFAVPVFEESFSAMGSALPGPTRFLIAVSRFLSGNALLLLAAAAIGILGLLLLGKTDGGRRGFARLALTLPALGPVNRMNAAARFASTLSAMLAAGLPLVQAARITAAAADNLLIAEDLHIAIQGVVEGRTLARGLQRSKYLPRLLVELTAVGEETGNLEETLTVAAAYYTREVDNTVKHALGILEPCITLVLAALVVCILLAVYLPIFGMYGSM